MERFEIRLHDGFSTFTSMFKTDTMEVLQADCEKMFAQMQRMGVDTGRIELRGEDNNLAEAWFFGAAQDRANEKRRKARRDAFHQKMYSAGLDDTDLMV